MTYTRHFIFCMISCISMHAASPAQDALTTQRASFYAFEVPAARTSIHLMTQKNTFIKLDLPGANATAPVTVANPDGNIAIYDQPVTGADGKKTYPLLGKITASSQWKEVMVILVAGKNTASGKEQITGFAFPMSKTDLPPGSIKFANLSPCLIRGALGNSKLLFKPGVIETITLDEKSGSMVNVVFQYQDDDAWQRMMATQWAAGNQERTLVFAFKNPLSGIMTSRSIPLRDD